MSFALVLGGGGSVGVAWEVGVLAALAEAGLDPAAADVIIGTSAGSVVGTLVRQGRTIDSLVAEQHAPPTAGDGADQRPTDLSPLVEIMGVLRGSTERTREVLQEVGRLAMAAPTPSESDWIARFEETVDDEWPATDLRITAVDCLTGTRRVWTADDGVPLAAAVASSCAIPAVFPPISLDGSRYTDGGVWSSSNLDVALDAEVDAAIFVGPLSSGDRSATSSLRREVELLRSSGRRVETIEPGPAFASEIGVLNLMNPEFRGRGLELGSGDGERAVDRVAEALV